MKAAFEVGETDRHGLDALFVLQILEALFLDLLRRDTVQPLLFGSGLRSSNSS
jgi:hypothetical protein